jgi:hypothetical protein
MPSQAAATSTFAPQYAFGNPVTASTTSSATSSTALEVFSSFSQFVSGYEAVIGANPARQFEARGVYDRTNNQFFATSIDFVL